MSFPALNALGFTAIEDDKNFADMPDDPSIRYESQGGLVVTRRRFTRTPNRIITTAFTDISSANKTLFDNFYSNVAGGCANSFTYINPVTLETLIVRFDAGYKPKYSGIGIHISWDIEDIKLRTV